MLPIQDTIPRRNPPVATYVLLLINSLVFLFELTLPPAMLERLFYLFGMVPARYTHPAWALLVGFPVDDYWPFLTSMFLHGGWLHIISNMWTLWIFGDNVEDRMGPVRFVIFYMLCGVAAGVVHWFANPDSTIPAVGASGAIAGVIGRVFLAVSSCARDRDVPHPVLPRSSSTCLPSPTLVSGRSARCSAERCRWHNPATSAA